jgi:hypothetical protein
MTTKSALKIVATDVPLSATERLVLERTEIESRLKILSTANSRHQEAEQALQGIDKQIAALNTREKEQWQQWALQGTGEPPVADNTERKSLMAARIDAEADLEAGKNAGMAIQPEIVFLNNKLRAIAGNILAAKIEECLSEARAERDLACKLLLEAKAPLIRIGGLASGLDQLRARAKSAENVALQATLTQAILELEGFKSPDTTITVGDAYQASDAWLAKLKV